MNTNNPAGYFTNTELESDVSNRMNEIVVAERLLPAIFIIYDVQRNAIFYMSKRGLEALNISPDQIHISYAEFQKRYLNPDYITDFAAKVSEMIQRNNDDEVVQFFHQVRTSSKVDGSWYLCSIKIFLRDKEGKPLLTLTMAIPIDTKYPSSRKMERLLNENIFLHRHQKVFLTLTRREKEILKLMALGLNSNEIANELHISENTASTHRRNIRNKINAQDNYDITYFAQAFDLI